MRLQFRVCLLQLAGVVLASAQRYSPQNLSGEATSLGESASGEIAHHIENRQAQVPYYQTCEAPEKKPGHCRHLKDCLIPAYNENYSKNAHHFCIIDEENLLYAGVCCPDDYDPMKSQGPPSRNMNRVLTPPGTASKVQSVPAQSKLCGINGKTQDRLSTGPADYTDWPWMVALIRYKAYKKTWIHFCGAVLISERHVLSAAHCFNAMKPTDAAVRIGAYDFKKLDDHPFTDYKVTGGKIHAEYDRATNENDIILLRLDRPVRFNKMVRPVCLPLLESDKTIDLINKTATVAGWGATSFGGPASSLLLEVTVPIWDHPTCKESYTQPIADTTLCASAYEGGKDACQGDSGGPLFFQRADGRWTNIGVVSWGVGCASKGKPGIYTRVTSFISWIAKAQKEMA